IEDCRAQPFRLDGSDAAPCPPRHGSIPTGVLYGRMPDPSAHHGMEPITFRWGIGLSLHRG
ncbi:hypothetical protein, partial [Cutibacterium granulosum]|uniref:hypothetical protein n=1 Tax=Cutibacterium granulosum TaxID=33011 RepID=UPI002B229666